MDRYLLDTHVAIWFFNGNDTLSETANRIIRDLSNPVFLSIVSVWELAIKAGMGKLDFDGKAAGFMRIAENMGITILPIKIAHLTALEELPLLHRDPAYLRYDDRLLVAAAISEQMSFISADKNIAQYNVPLIW